MSETTAQPHGRIYNFSAGPGALPLEVLEQAREEMLNWRGCGMSVVEMSHRSKEFESIINTAEADLRTLLNIPANYKVLFLQGGATLQFTMVPQNLRATGQSADYIDTGAWAKAAIKEAKKSGPVRVAGTSENTNYDSAPAHLEFDPQAAYVHYTSNETIGGVEWPSEPSVTNGVPLVCDASSDFISRPIEVNQYGLIYAGAQKNLGPAGVTIVIVREDLLARTPTNLPLMLDYKVQAENKSLYNTPPTFAIYMVGLVLQWAKRLGGLKAMAARNTRKAQFIYDAVDHSGGFYRGHAQPQFRSKMNITFRLPDENLEKAFIKESEAAGFSGLKGHRSVGGLRASTYNAFPPEGAEALAQFMREFQRKNG